MIARWLAQMNQRERMLALSVGGILFLLVNLAIWSALFGMSAGARAEYAAQRATRTEQTVYLEEEKMWKNRADWLKKKQPHLNNPAEASTLLTQVKEIAGKYNVQIDNPQIGAGRDDPFASVGLGHLRDEERIGVRSCIFFTTPRGRRRLPFSSPANLMVDANDPTVMRGRFKIAKWFSLRERNDESERADSGFDRAGSLPNDCGMGERRPADDGRVRALSSRC